MAAGMRLSRRLIILGISLVGLVVLLRVAVGPLNGAAPIYPDGPIPPLDLAAIREGAPVPRRFLAHMPPDFHTLEVQDGLKGRFLSIVLPLVLAENEALGERRARIAGLLDKRAAGTSLTVREQDILNRACAEFGVDEKEPEALLERIDQVPVSLALAQSIEESGWGRSNFTREGRALFGQWTFDPDKGVRLIRRKSGLVFAVRKFDTLEASVRAYMHNLNTHRAYGVFRTRRAWLREKGEPLTGLALAETLKHYSERRGAYVAGLRGMIRLNRLDQFDGAQLINR